MGGYGSGRQSYRQKTDGCRSLDVNRMKREGWLRPGYSGNLIWSQNGEEIGRIGYHVTDEHLVLDYRSRQNGGDWEPITEHVRLTQADCTYGGARTYFICPGVVSGRACGRRVAKLFAGGSYFLCRHCYNLAYNSQSEPRHDRMLRRANKIRTALGGEPGTAYLIALKPKGMWYQTYQRKRWEIEWCEHQANLGFLSQYRQLLSQEEIEMYFGPDVI